MKTGRSVLLECDLSFPFWRQRVIIAYARKCRTTFSNFLKTLSTKNYTLQKIKWYNKCTISLAINVFSVFNLNTSFKVCLCCNSKTCISFKLLFFLLIWLGLCIYWFYLFQLFFQLSIEVNSSTYFNPITVIYYV